MGGVLILRGNQDRGIALFISFTTIRIVCSMGFDATAATVPDRGNVREHHRCRCSRVLFGKALRCMIVAMMSK